MSHARARKAPRRTHHDVPQPLRLSRAVSAVRVGGEAAEHCRTADDRAVAVRGQHDGHAAHVCEELHQLAVLRLPAAHEDRGNRVARGVERVDDVARLERDGEERGVVCLREVHEGIVLVLGVSNLWCLVGRIWSAPTRLRLWTRACGNLRWVIYFLNIKGEVKEYIIGGETTTAYHGSLGIYAGPL